MASGMMAPAVAPLSSRNAPSHARLSARAPAATVNPDRNVATAITVYLPKRSPSAPTKTWQSPYDTAKAVAITEAPPAVVPNSPAICGSKGSATRSVAADAKAAALSSTIGRMDGAAAGSDIGDRLLQPSFGNPIKRPPCPSTSLRMRGNAVRSLMPLEYAPHPERSRRTATHFPGLSFNAWRWRPAVPIIRAAADRGRSYSGNIYSAAGFWHNSAGGILPPDKRSTPARSG